VPIQTIVDAAQEHDATAIGLSALLVSTSKQMPACIQELYSKGLSYPVLIGGAAINRAFGYRALYPGGKDSEERYEPGVFYCKDAFEGLAVMDQLIDGDARTALVEKLMSGAREFRERPQEVEVGPPTTDDSVRSAARTDAPVPTPPFWGAREIPVDLAEVYPHLDTHVLFKLHWGGRGKKGEEWQALLRDEFRPRLERMWREQDYLHPRALLGFFPCYALGNEIVVLDPEDRTRELTRLVCPRQPKGERICLADFFRPALDGGPPEQLDVIALQAVTVGGEVSELLTRLEQEGLFAEQLYVHGLAVQTAEGLAEWLHAEARRMLGIPATQGRRYSWGYPAIPEQSEHLKVERLLELAQIGLSITEGYAPDPEQSTLALVAHHPQAIYFGSRQGRLPAQSSPDDIIRGSASDPTLLSALDEADPPDGAAEGEDEPAMAG
jgi:5-methyltetrahydrofolate--homocysteine methyltransferase